MEQGNKLGKSKEKSLENKTSWISHDKISLIAAVSTIIVTTLGVIIEIAKYYCFINRGRFLRCSKILFLR